MKSSKVRVRRCGTDRFVASVTLKGETESHFDSEPEVDAEVAAARGKAWAAIHGINVSVILFESGIKALSVAGDDYAESP